MRSAATAALTLTLARTTTAARSMTTVAFVSSSRDTPRSLLRSTFATEGAAMDPSHDVRKLLPYEEGGHNSVKIKISNVPEIFEDPYQMSTFRERLEDTIEVCRELKKSSIWVEVPMSRASLIEPMTETGLQFHHAEGETANLMLWLLEDTECKIPEYATHQLGVGAMVVNSRNEILCVRELRKNYMPWKVPGGLSELGENIDEAIIREVMEETGVACNFLSVISFRHTHNLQFGRSDMYFMCRLEPIEEIDENGNAIIPTPVPEAGEIEKAEWLPIQEYKDMISGENGHPMMSHIVNIFEQSADIQRTVISSIVPGRRPAPIYHSPVDSNQIEDTM